MKKTYFLFIVFFIMLSCNKESGKQQIVLKNSADFAIHNQPLVLSRSQFEASVKIPETNTVPLLTTEKGDTIAYQLDDLDKDSIWDELAMVIDFDTLNKRKFFVEFIAPDKLPEFKKRTNIRFALKPNKQGQSHELTTAFHKPDSSGVLSENLQMEGPAWENDIVGFRNYFDKRNGMDIFGKQTPEMALDKAGINGQNYHELDNWGMDILKVGNSLGAGAIALMINDSLYRIGTDCKISFTNISEGPVRSILELKCENWSALDRNYTVIHRISIWAGQHYYLSQVKIDGLQGDEKLVAGMVNKHSDTVFVQKNADFVSIATHDNQAFKGEKLGIALMVHKDNFVKQETTPDTGEGIIETYYAVMNIDKNKFTPFRFYACWELQDQKFAEKKHFLNFLANQARQFSVDIQPTGNKN